MKTFFSQSDSFVTAGDAAAVESAFINGEIIQSAERVIPASAATLVSPSNVDVGSDKATIILRALCFASY